MPCNYTGLIHCLVPTLKLAVCLPVAKNTVSNLPLQIMPKRNRSCASLLHFEGGKCCVMFLTPEQACAQDLALYYFLELACKQLGQAFTETVIIMKIFCTDFTAYN